jgi:DNA helicase IV
MARCSHVAIDRSPVKQVHPSVFDLPDNLAHKGDPASIGPDEQHFSAVQSSIEKSRLDTAARLEAAQKSSGRMGREVMERDFEIHRLGGRLRSLRRYGVDLCLGRVVTIDTDVPVYIGRLGLLGTAGDQLLVDWRSPAAEPFFGATHANPMGLRSRRRYRWTNGTISDYWDEVFDLTGPITETALDDQSAFIASLGSARSPRMRDVLGTVQADQDAIIRADSHGALVVDGGPGTGKTVVALHRTAYLLYAQSRLGHSRGGVLVVGPHEPYLAYVSDVLPSLGEDGVQTCTLRDLVAEGSNAAEETDPFVAQLKATANMAVAIEAAVAFYEQPPTRTMIVETEWADLTLTAADWAEAFEAPEPGTPHNEAREQVWDLLLTILTDRHDGDETPNDIRKSLQNNNSLRAELERSWTIIDAADLVADLWSVPAYLRSCAPWLGTEDVRALQRPDPTGWTASDLPLLDAARMRLGDPEHAHRTRRREIAATAERVRMDRVVDELMAADDDEMMAAQLRQDGIRDALVDSAGFEEIPSDPLVGPFAHVVVDEAQELTDAQWQMVLSRCPSGSITIVGDRAQARLGFAESWRERLARVGLDRVEISTLGVNYRTPLEVMTEAEPVIRAALPDANVPVSIRSTGVPVEYGDAADLLSILDRWLESNVDGIACVIGDPTFPPSGRIRSLTPQSTKGLEFDLVVLIDPDSFGSGIAGAVDKYVAMTRATGHLVVLTTQREAASRTSSTA